MDAVLKGGWTKDQQETKDKAEYYWGGLDSQRVQLSAGRDITLSPAQNDEALNCFGYPYGEVDGSAPSLGHDGIATCRDRPRAIPQCYSGAAAMRTERRYVGLL